MTLDAVDALFFLTAYFVDWYSKSFKKKKKLFSEHHFIQNYLFFDLTSILLEKNFRLLNFFGQQLLKKTKTKLFMKYI